MSTRTVNVVDGAEVVTTTNGVATTTHSVMATEHAQPNWRDTFDPDSGINKAVLAAVRKVVATSNWWNQSVWRMALGPQEYVSQLKYGLDEQAAGEEIAEVLAFTPDSVENACGTAMCTAGWAAELTRPDWVLDASLLKPQYRERASVSRWDLLDDMIYVRRHDDKAFEYYVTASGSSYIWDVIEDSELVRADAQARGFSRDTHDVITVREYAKVAMGIGNDPLQLFDGDNKLDEVLFRIDTYLAMTKPVGEYTYSEIKELQDAVQAD